MEKIIIDSHSHLGVGFKGRIATPDEYMIVKEKYNISLSLLMPQPILNREKRNILLFDDINMNTYNIICNSPLKDSSFFIPMISPIYMDASHIERYIELYHPVAFKIHYKSDFSFPEIICNDIIKLLKKYDIPLIVHTDYSPQNNDLKGKNKNLNSSLKWFRFFIKNNIKGYLTHGARLNKEVMREINKCDNVVIGVGPDLLLQNYSESDLEINTEYLKCLHDNVNPKNLLFDVDYNWNLTSENDFDYDSLYRINMLWNSDEANLILGDNSKKFFKIKIKER